MENGPHALFSIDNKGVSPFHLACRTVTHTKMMQVVEESRVRYILPAVDASMVITHWYWPAIEDTVSLEMVCTLLSEDNRIQCWVCGIIHVKKKKEEDEEFKTIIVSSLSSSNSNNSSNNPIAHRNNNNQHTTDITANDNYGTEGGHQNKNNSNNGNDNSNDGNASSNNNHNNGISSRIIRKRKRN